MRGLRAASWGGVGAALVWMASSGCSTYTAYRARFHAPDYTVTAEYYARSPRRVAVFPFGARSTDARSLEKAQVCRVAFYQHFSARDFEDVDMQALDRRLLPETGKARRGLLREFAGMLRKIDVVGITSFLDLKSLVGEEKWDTSTFRAWTRDACRELETDAYVLGVVRGYGRLYAVVFSSIGIATHVEMRAREDDALLWRADFKARDIALPLTIDPLDVPMLLFDIWRNSRGESLDLLAFKVYRDVMRTLPAARAEGGVRVRAERERTRVFARPTLWTFWPGPHVAKGESMRFRQERRGWYDCEGADGQAVWMLVRDGGLVGGSGAPLEVADPLGGLWKKDP